MIALLRTYLGASLDHPAQAALRQIPGGMLPGKHEVYQNTQGVNVRPGVGLGEAVLLRRGEASGAQNHGVAFMGRLVQPGGVKVDQHRIPPPENDVFRLYVPVDRADGVQHPQGLAELEGDVPGLVRRKLGNSQKRIQGISLNKFLQHQDLAILLRRLQNFREVPAGIAHELSVDLSAAKEAVKNEKPSRLFVTEEKRAAPRILLQGADLFKFLRNDAGEPSVNKRPPPKKRRPYAACIWFSPPPSGMVKEIPAAFPSQAI